MGRRTVPRATGVRIEAWAPSRELCVAEAVAAMVDGFADLAGSEARGAVELRVHPGSDEDLLIDVLDEVIYLVETAGQVPVATHIEPDEGGLRVWFELTDAELAEPRGLAPKAISLHDLRFVRDSSGWSCGVTLDA